MKSRCFKYSLVFMVGVMVLAGCATTRARRPNPQVEQANQIAQLQGELQAKDAKIQELEAKVQSYQSALQTVPAPSSAVSAVPGGTINSALIHVPGVTVQDVQQALIRAGFNPGPVDGRAGRKTKSAIRAFQRRYNLRADGIVGEKTWARLK